MYQPFSCQAGSSASLEKVTISDSSRGWAGFCKPNMRSFCERILKLHAAGIGDWKKFEVFTQDRLAFEVGV